VTRSARLLSVDAVERLATAIKLFAEDVSSALDDLDMQVNRVREWIGHERKHYWTEQVRRTTLAVSEAKVTLERARMFGIGKERPTCREEKDALEKAKRNLETAQEKVQRVRHWTHQLDHELREFRGGLSQLVTWLQAEYPRAEARLKRMMDALDQYVVIEPLPDSVAQAASLLEGESLANAARATGEDPPAPKTGNDENAVDDQPTEAVEHPQEGEQP
jgi:soluble cytochrome b562